MGNRSRTRRFEEEGIETIRREEDLGEEGGGGLKSHMRQGKAIMQFLQPGCLHIKYTRRALFACEDENMARSTIGHL